MSKEITTYQSNRSTTSDTDFKLTICGDTPTVAVLGTGRYGRALTNRLRYAGYDVRIGSRAPSDPSGTLSLFDACTPASIIFLCVPPIAHDAILASISLSLRPDTLLVDISNHGLSAPPRLGVPSIAERLSNAVPPGVVVAKALNTLAAEALEKDSLSTIVAPPAHVACDDRTAAATLCSVLADITLTPVLVGPLNRARDLERIAHRQFPLWNMPLIVSVIVGLFWAVYFTVYKYVALVPSGLPGVPGFPIKTKWDSLPMALLFHAAAEASMTLLSLTFIAGPIATLVQLARGSSSRSFPSWFTGWLNARKELGLCALGFAVPHAIAGLTHVPKSIPIIENNAFYAFGVLALAAFALVSVSSSPGVAAGLSWREARTVFSWLGLLAFAFAAVHHFLYAWHLDNRSWSALPRLGAMPLSTTGWLGFICVAVTVALRVIVWSPPVVRLVRKLHCDTRVVTTK